jgi:hypothetical protein
MRIGNDAVSTDVFRQIPLRSILAPRPYYGQLRGRPWGRVLWLGDSPPWADYWVLWVDTNLWRMPLPLASDLHKRVPGNPERIWGCRRCGPEGGDDGDGRCDKCRRPLGRVVLPPPPCKGAALMAWLDEQDHRTEWPDTDEEFGAIRTHLRSLEELPQLYVGV